MAIPILRRKLFRLAVFLVFILLLLQLYRPALNNPPVTHDLEAPKQVAEILRKACYDCHSNETNLRWYDQIAPARWLVAEDVKKARKVLNFSNWDSLSPDQQHARLFEALNQIVFHAMPLSQYTLMHRDARLSEADIAVLKKWLSYMSQEGTASCMQIGAAHLQYNSWIAANTGNDQPGPAIAPEPNGLAFIPDYRNWQPISSTERWDNGTMRVILGNPIAVTAIRTGNTHPWPDGAVFAKVAWQQLNDTGAGLLTGEFKQVELMVKDHEKYKATGGWGWGRWKGVGLTPYGKDASFTGECVRCHQPMKDNDLVFSTPINWRAQAGTGADSNAFDPLDWQLISSRIDKDDKTMSTVYGNEIAVSAIRKGQSYPQGAKIALVTWSQKEDEHWFGALIPASIQSVEKLIYGAQKRPSYEYYGGFPLTRAATTDSTVAAQAVKYITAQRPSVIP